MFSFPKRQTTWDHFPFSGFTQQLPVNDKIVYASEDKMEATSKKTTGRKGLNENETKKDTRKNENACDHEKRVHGINVSKREPMSTNKHYKRRVKNVLVASRGGHEDKRQSKRDGQSNPCVQDW